MFLVPIEERNIIDNINNISLKSSLKKEQKYIQIVGKAITI